MKQIVGFILKLYASCLMPHAYAKALAKTVRNIVICIRHSAYSIVYHGTWPSSIYCFYLYKIFQFPSSFSLLLRLFICYCQQMNSFLFLSCSSVSFVVFSSTSFFFIELRAPCFNRFFFTNPSFMLPFDCK